MTEQSPRWGRPDPMADPPSPSQWRNLPNALTMLRLALVPVFGYLLLAADSDGARWLAAVVFVVASLTDLADGAIARSRNLVTTFGKVADPIADKALTGVALLGLSWLGELPWWITVVILGREITITLTRFIVIRHGVIPASRGGKAKTVSQMLAILLYIVPVAGWVADIRGWVMLIAVALTVLTGIDYVARAVHLRRNSERTAMKKARREHGA
ncbi:MAG: CDP-diacylglycerol--glycerol-3-phosphate 3-phosphatidyltransferase [Micrococcales bacterium]|jgi:CDP-diacylglycerol---glycerol-3-phosphate 3-phosphatidyltransferase|nr:CDP-diacylglycerol--glycerol-3-phosphate 3-phosphatidyltransferase [Micrococcales bacterium]